MDFLRNRSLKELAMYLLAAMLMIFLIEFLFIKNKIEILEEIDEKKDYARSAQIESQQLAYLVQLHLSGQPALTGEIYARINELDHKLNVLGNGGRVDNSKMFLQPLSRLPGITFTQVDKSWREYKESIVTLIVEEPDVQEEVTQDSSIVSSNDSTQVPQVVATSKNLAITKTLLPGQWLTLSKWYEKLMTDFTEEAEQKKTSVENSFLVLIVLDFILLASLFYLFNRYVLSPIKKLHANAANHQQDNTFTKNEIGAVSEEMNQILEELKDATEFVAAIGEGKLDFDYTVLDQNYAKGKNRLADSLISMQEKLKVLNEEEQRRQWANEGLTKFVDILRSSNDNISTLGDKIISALVRYTNSNQGGLYVLNDEDQSNKHLELISLFAFDIKKYDTKKVKLGEGILGQTFLEKETTVLNEIPDEYIRITSGLGEANPRSLLMVPLKVDKEVYGIVELASFKTYQPHEISFVEKLAETIASTLASVKVAGKNRQLIEQFQQQTEEMRAQEEEMRQNMEELQATQEELARKEQDYIKRIKDLESNQSIAPEEIEKLREEFREKEQNYLSEIRILESKLAEKPPRADDWALAEELERTLRVQIEAMKITQSEIDKKN